MLVNALGVVGFDSPTLSERFFLIEAWAHAAGGAVRFALVVQLEMIDPNKFGVTVARNRGLVGEVFASEADALAWLDSLR